jgi:hypothetical protein
MTPPEETTPDLIRGLVGDARELALAHVEGMKLELRREMAELRTASWRAALAIAVFTLGAILVAFGAVQALWMYTPLPQWAAFLILAAVFIAVGVVALKTLPARRDMDLVPEEQLDKASTDARWLARRTRDALS